MGLPRRIGTQDKNLALPSAYWDAWSSLQGLEGPPLPNSPP